MVQEREGRHAFRRGAIQLRGVPALLPGRSWQALLDGCADHFGASLDLAPDELDALSDYLTVNAADTSGTEISEKIMDCLRGAAPLRITDVPAFQHKHRKISADVLKRESVAGCKTARPATWTPSRAITTTRAFRDSNG
jgi:hypothetical protein